MLEIQLPTPCDISRTAYWYAAFTGRKHDLGAPLKLMAAPEETRLAHFLCENFPFSGPTALEDYKKIECEICPTWPPRKWALVFERGLVSSEGPELSGL
jgi:hypothetical protein